MKIIFMKWLMPLPTFGSNTNVGLNLLEAGLGRGPAPAQEKWWAKAVIVMSSNAA